MYNLHYLPKDIQINQASNYLNYKLFTNMSSMYMKFKHINEAIVHLYLERFPSKIIQKVNTMKKRLLKILQQIRTNTYKLKLKAYQV